jgi:hypothetical protein
VEQDMSGTTTRGYPYPGLSDGQVSQLAAYYQNLAEAVDDDVQTVADKVFTPPYVKLVQQSAQSLSTGSAAALTFGTGSTVYDTHGFHSESVNNTRITPSIPGIYRAVIIVSMTTPSSAFSQLLAVLRKNTVNIDSSVPVRPDAASISGCAALTVTDVDVNGTTDYLEAFGQQNGPSTANTQTTAGFRSLFELKWLRPLP